MKQFFVLSSIFVLIIVNCKKENSDTNTKNPEYIEYGTSFGECIGYCKSSLKVTKEKIICKKSSWGTLEDVTTSKDNNNEDWTKLLNKINLNTFFSLDSIYGCPDCADDGAEWIEIKRENKTHKVIFEFGEEPEALKAILQSLSPMKCE